MTRLGCGQLFFWTTTSTNTSTSTSATSKRSFHTNYERCFGKPQLSSFSAYFWLLRFPLPELVSDSHCCLILAYLEVIRTGARQYTRAVLSILLKFTLLTPFLHTSFFSLLLLGSHPSSLMHYLGRLLKFPIWICDALIRACLKHETAKWRNSNILQFSEGKKKCISQCPKFTKTEFQNHLRYIEN